MRRAHKKFRQEPSDELLEQILHGSEWLAAMYECAQHEVRGLTEAIQLEKKKRKRGKSEFAQ